MAELRQSPNISPIFVRYPAIAHCRLTNQVCNRDPGTTVPELLYSAGTAGSFVEAIQVTALGANIQSVLRLYYSLPFVAGYHLLSETPLPAVTVTPSDNAIASYPVLVKLPKVLFPASPNPSIPNEGLRLPQGAELRCALGSAIASGINVTAFAGEY